MALDGGSRTRGDGGLPPIRKSLGQHFLRDRSILRRIAEAIEPDAGDVVIEIGPGRGALTEILLERAGRIIAIEYDRALASLLGERYAGDERVTVIQSDVLEVDLRAAAGAPFKLVGNVPYYITTPIIFHALTAPRPLVAAFLVQREVAERIVAAPGSREYGALSVNVQAVADARIVFGVPAGAFVPPPKVESALVKLVPREEPAVEAGEEAGFATFVQALFGMRRKQMARAIRGVLGLESAAVSELLSSAGIEPSVRVETLSAQRLAGLFRAVQRGAA